VSAEYWRLLFTDQTGTFALAIAEVEMRATLGGYNEISTGGVIAEASSIFSPHLPNNSRDANPATIWSSAGFLTSGGNHSYLRYQFPSAVHVEQISVTVRPDVDGHPVNWLVQSSPDGSVWTTEWAVMGQTGWALGETRVYDRVAGDLAATKSTTYGVLGPPLLLSSTKSVMYVVTGPTIGRRFKARLVTQPR
jgi:hypothetical protein